MDQLQSRRQRAALIARMQNEAYAAREQQAQRAAKAAPSRPPRRRSQLPPGASPDAAVLGAARARPRAVERCGGVIWTATRFSVALGRA